MLPASRSLLHDFACRLHTVPLGVAAMALASTMLTAPAHAQDSGKPPSGTAAPADGASADQAQQPVEFEADRVDYSTESEIVTATGNVVLNRAGQSVRANTVTWNRETGVIVADGDVRMLDEDGNEVFTERVELTDELRTGAMENLLLVLREGGRLAANSGRRLDNGDIILNRAAYTACTVENADGCPKEPSWRVTAREVIYEADRNRVVFKGARIVFFGVLAIPIPGLQTSTDGGGLSGFLVPDFRFTPSNGVEISQPYYARFGNNRDLTVTGYLYTEAPPMAEVQYRELNSKGAFQITGYATHSRRISTAGTSPEAEKDFRGYIFANGRFQLSSRWSVTTSIRRATDRTFLRRYDISRDDRLRSMVDVERIGNESYFSFSGWATQTMRIGADQGQVPTAFPIIDYRHRVDEPILGGRIELQANSLAITRTAGQDTQRAFARAQWDLRRVTSMGQLVTLTALLRTDVYHSENNYLTPTPSYRGNPGWETRAIAIAALDVKWPLVGRALGGTQVFTPRVQLAATPPIKNLAVPNEDSRAIDLEDSNLFALNRFPGYDRVEDGARITYGFDWQLDRSRWRIRTNVGQSVRLSNKPSLFPDGTGLTDRVSDIVGRTEIRYRDFLSLVHRFRLDKDSLAARRTEFDAVIGNQRTYAEIGYVKLDRDISTGLEDLQDREEVRAAARVAFARYWSMFGSAVVNLTDRKEDPSLGSDGFQPLRTRLGIAYLDECLELAFTWRRDYAASGDARRGNSFQVRFALRNLGFR